MHMSAQLNSDNNRNGDVCLLSFSDSLQHELYLRNTIHMALFVVFLTIPLGVSTSARKEETTKIFMALQLLPS